MNRFVCIHGHFYQPPRENPWLEEIELQDSAYPYHDWNERITEECYGPNATSRILDSDGRITRIVNNYSRISFNFGPTLLSWMEKAQPDVYNAILEADRESQSRFSGHGSALAQVYNHMIMPLANARDMHTQVFWGIRDFERRFGRAPEGMWLAETAVNCETLEVLAEQGIKFTILAPYQAKRMRKLGARTWRDASDGKIDPRMPYRQTLPSGRTIDLFFYDGPTSQAVAFERLLDRGETFARRLMKPLDEESDEPQLSHIATDGETYGHHHRHGDMALAYALQFIEDNELATLTNYGEYLERFPPTHEAQILDNTSWSCAHGVERWRSNCGCHTGGHSDWNQKWRKPLREALDWLRDRLIPLYEEEAKKYVMDPWRARDDYIDLILDRSHHSLEAFRSRHATRILNDDEKIRFMKLFEVQRHAMLMYTSCGWFFDELSGIETVQVINYAGRAIQLAQEVFGQELEEPFLERLEKAKSNIQENRDGRRVYERFVKPAFVDLNRVGAHYIIASLFDGTESPSRIHCYLVDDERSESFETGKNSMVIGHARFTSNITFESRSLSFGAVYFGHHSVNAGVREYQGDEAFEKLLQDASEVFDSADFPAIIRTFDKHFGDSSYSLISLFRDQQRHVLDKVLRTTLEEVETHYRQLYENQAPLIRFLNELRVPVPEPLQMAAEFVVNANLRKLLGSEKLRRERIKSVLTEVHETNLSLHTDELKHTFQTLLEQKANAFLIRPSEVMTLEDFHVAAQVLKLIPFEINIRKPQNIVYFSINRVYREMKSRADTGDESAQRWVELFGSLAELLHIKVP